MDVFLLLQKDHDAIRELLVELETPELERRTFLRARFRVLHDELKRHALAELEVVYPRLHGFREGRAIAEQAFLAHRRVDKLLDELVSLSTEDERWWPMFEELRDEVRAHFDEEEDTLFKRLHGLTRETDWGEMGRAVARVKEKCLAA